MLIRARTIAGVLALLLVWNGLHAQVRGRILREARVDAEQATLTVKFNVPVDVSNITPPREGNFLRIGLLLVPAGAVLAVPTRETLGASPADTVPISDIVYEVEAGLSPTLEITFTRTVRFTVRQGSDARSVIIALEKQAPIARPAPTATPEPQRAGTPQPAEEPAATEALKRPRPQSEDVQATPAPAAAAPIGDLPYTINLLSSRRPVDSGHH